MAIAIISNIHICDTAALGLGVPQQSTVCSGLAGLGVAHQTPLGSFFGSGGTSPLAGIAGLNKSLQPANGGYDLMQLAALLGGSQQQPATFQPAQLMQVRQALAGEAITCAVSIDCGCCTEGSDTQTY